MSALSLALPRGVDPVRRRRSLREAHTAFLGQVDVSAIVRPVVLDSWQRSAALGVDPDGAGPPVILVDDSLAEARERSPLRLIMPLVEALMWKDAEDSGVIVTVGDAAGNLLWVDGDRSLCRRAERIHLMPGAVWTEQSVGTAAPGTALAVDQTVQIFGGEHYSRIVQPWSCTAGAIHDPSTRAVIGVLNITGHTEIASPQAAILMRSTIAAIEAELRLAGLVPELGSTRLRRSPAHLSVLGRDRGVLACDGRRIELSLRHTELLMLLATQRGMSSGELAWELYEREAAEVTVRAEMSRLRKILPGLVSAGRPYQLRDELRTDAGDVAGCLGRGAHRHAVELYRGPVLPRSTAPGIVELREGLHGWLRRSLLEHASAHVLLTYAHSPDGRFDIDVWRACLSRLPAGSARRAEVVATVERLDHQLGTDR
jgi:hypothetical protein